MRHKSVSHGGSFESKPAFHSTQKHRHIKNGDKSCIKSVPQNLVYIYLYYCRLVTCVSVIRYFCIKMNELILNEEIFIYKSKSQHIKNTKMKLHDL